MSEKDQKASHLYDFIYVNIDKIYSYYSQLDDAGLLQSIKKSSSKSLNTGAGGGVNIPPIVSAEGKVSGSKSENVEHFFDFSQAIPAKTIDALNGAGLVCDDIKMAKYGQLVYMAGSVALINSDVISLQVEHNIQQKRMKKTSDSIQGEKILKHFAPLTSLHVKSRDFTASIWALLEEKYLVGRSIEYFLKYGSKLNGEWFVLGILDAKPDDGSSEENENDYFMVNMLNTFSSGIRGFLGRKDNDYVITPIAIWRKVE